MELPMQNEQVETIPFNGHDIATGIYAFYSASEDTRNGEGTFEFKNQKTGEISPVNYVGSMINGKPGIIGVAGDFRHNVHIPNADSYVLVGKIGPENLMQCDVPSRNNVVTIKEYPKASVVPV
jgi:hypothetical protein